MLSDFCLSFFMLFSSWVKSHNTDQAILVWVYGWLHLWIDVLKDLTFEVKISAIPLISLVVTRGYISVRDAMRILTSYGVSGVWTDIARYVALPPLYKEIQFHFTHSFS